MQRLSAFALITLGLILFLASLAGMAVTLLGAR